MAINRDLFKKTAQEANASASQFGENLGPGNYIMDLTDCKMAVSKKTSNEMVTMEFSVVEPEELKGRKHWEHSVITNKVGLSFLFQRMAALGYDTNAIDSPETLIEFVDDIKKSGYRVASSITVRGSGTEARTNFKIDGIIQTEGGDDTMEAEQEAMEAMEAMEAVVEEVKPTKPAATPKTETKAPAKPVEVQAVPEEPEAYDEEVEPEPEAYDGEVEPEPEADDEEVELSVGNRVKFSYKGTEVSGEVTEIDDQKGTAKVKGAKDIYNIAVDAIIAIL